MRENTYNNNLVLETMPLLRTLAMNTYSKVGACASKALGKSPLKSHGLAVFQNIQVLLFKVALPNPVLVSSFFLYWDSRSYWYIGEFVLGRYELETMYLLEKLLRPGMVMVDVGANIGYFSLQASKIVGSTGKVFSFEPDPSTFLLLKKNVKANKLEKTIIPINEAVKAKSGYSPFYIGVKSSGVGSLFKAPGTGSTKVTVKTTSLDEYFEKLNWPKIDFIKIDVEGAEKFVLEGMNQVVKRNNDIFLIMEFGPECQESAGVSNNQFFDMLFMLGFKSIWLIATSPISVRLPEDLEAICNIAKKTGYVNLLCSKREFDFPKIIKHAAQQ
jgi:FkbM family methyltransferase